MWHDRYYLPLSVCVHFVLYEDEFYLKEQTCLMKDSVEFYFMKYNPKTISNVSDNYHKTE